MPLVILDRDGVINEDSADFIKSVDEWIPIPGSIDAIARLCQAGFTVVVATNQSGLGRGLFTLEDLDAMHQHLNTLVEQAGGKLAGIYYCPHTPDAGCDCRKPLPGLLDTIATDLKVELQGAAMVGDSLRDLQAGMARGCRPFLVRTGKGLATEASLIRDLPDELNDPLLKSLMLFDDLAHCADYLIIQDQIANDIH